MKYFDEPIPPLRAGCRSPCGERGLKYASLQFVDSVPQRRSPCGERGLKSRPALVRRGDLRRSPCGERGLKWPFATSESPGVGVAPRAGSVD